MISLLLALAVSAAPDEPLRPTYVRGLFVSVPANWTLQREEHPSGPNSATQIYEGRVAGKPQLVTLTVIVVHNGPDEKQQCPEPEAPAADCTDGPFRSSRETVGGEPAVRYYSTRQRPAPAVTHAGCDPLLTWQVELGSSDGVSQLQELERRIVASIRFPVAGAAAGDSSPRAFATVAMTVDAVTAVASEYASKCAYGAKRAKPLLACGASPARVRDDWIARQRQCNDAIDSMVQDPPGRVEDTLARCRGWASEAPQVIKQLNTAIVAVALEEQKK